MNINKMIEEAIDELLNDPIHQSGEGDCFSAQSLMTGVLPDGRIIEAQLVITTIKEDLIAFHPNHPDVG